ncbi:unnamed protein product [Arctogadus glacialis]
MEAIVNLTGFACEAYVVIVLNATLIWDGRVRQSSSDLTEPTSDGTEPALPRRDSLSPPQTGQPQPSPDGTASAILRRDRALLRRDRASPP